MLRKMEMGVQSEVGYSLILHLIASFLSKHLNTP